MKKYNCNCKCNKKDENLGKWERIYQCTACKGLFKKSLEVCPKCGIENYSFDMRVGRKVFKSGLLAFFNLVPRYKWRLKK